MEDFIREVRLSILDLYKFWALQIRETWMNTFKPSLMRWIISISGFAVVFAIVRFIRTGQLPQISFIDVVSLIVTMAVIYIGMLLRDVARNHRYYRANISPEQYFIARPYNPRGNSLMDGVGIEFCNDNPIQIEIEGVYIVAVIASREYVFDENVKDKFIRLPFYKEMKLSYERQSVERDSKTIYEIANWKGNGNKPDELFWSVYDADQGRLPPIEIGKEYRVFLRCYLHTPSESETLNRYFRTAVVIRRGEGKLTISRLKDTHREH